MTDKTKNTKKEDDIIDDVRARIVQINTSFRDDEENPEPMYTVQLGAVVLTKKEYSELMELSDNNHEVGVRFE